MDEELNVTSLESELMSIDESKLPEVIEKRINDLATINSSYERALDKKRQVEAKIDESLKEAEKLVESASKLTTLSPETHRLLKWKFSFNKDRIEALEKCVLDMAKHGVDTAEFQKIIASVEKASLESQTAIMDVQKLQMEYMERTTDVMKFLYALSAYDIASTQSIVTNLELVLSGAKKKDLGEMAKQQMFLVMDQLKSQENIQISLRKNSDRISDLEKQLATSNQKDEVQDAILERQAAKDAEHDAAIAAGLAKDAKQDELISKQIIKDQEHDRLLSEGVAKDVEQDKLIQEQIEKGEEQDRLIAEGEKTDLAQNELIEQSREKIDELQK
ncbi:MAG: hypothetical protein K6A74_04920 [Lachnospiraceae bacterium]|nr:hypothetical protein [Lachnospiraceae bacterium]